MFCMRDGSNVGQRLFFLFYLYVQKVSNKRTALVLDVDQNFLFLKSFFFFDGYHSLHSLSGQQHLFHASKELIKYCLFFKYMVHMVCRFFFPQTLQVNKSLLTQTPLSIK